MTAPDGGPGTLVLLRHGRTEWTETGRIAGWEDPPLSGVGRADAARAGRQLVSSGLRLDVVVRSLLRRSAETAEVVAGVHGEPAPALVDDWRLNERHFGALQGLDHEVAKRRFGKEELRRWMRGGDAPPAVALDDRRHPRHDRRYRHLDPRVLPGTESLAQLSRRVAACYDGVIWPMLESGATVLVVAHRYSLAALVAHLGSDRLSAPGEGGPGALVPGEMLHLEPRAARSARRRPGSRC